MDGLTTQKLAPTYAPVSFIVYVVHGFFSVSLTFAVVLQSVGCLEYLLECYYKLIPLLNIVTYLLEYLNHIILAL